MSRFVISLFTFVKALSMSASYTVLIRPSEAKTAVHGCQHSGLCFISMVDRGLMPRYQRGLRAVISLAYSTVSLPGLA